MTLGEKILKLRSTAKMSQGDLAEKLNVSRQSISKWETNQSVPEMDKLIQLSDLFHISLDDLVRSKDPEENDNPKEDTSTPPPQQTQILIHHSMSTQKIVGFILLGLGLLCCLLALVLGSGLLIIGGYIILCSILCLVLKRYVGLVMGWITMIQAIILTPLFTGVRMLSIFNPGYIRHAGINQIISILMWVFLAALIIRTALVITKHRK